MIDMKANKTLMRICCIIFTLIIGDVMTSAYMIQEPTIHADTTDQTNARTDQLAMLTTRMDELEQSRVNDLKELDLRVKELSEFRENDARALARLNGEVEEQTRLRFKDLHLITVLSTRIEELERQCGNGQHSDNFISMETQNPPRNETSYSNGTDVFSPYHTPSALDDTATNEEELSKHSADAPNSETIKGQGRIESRQPGRKIRVSPSVDTVAFHAILTHTISNLATNQAVTFDRLVTNSGGVNYSPNTGIFTATQSGVHVFSWAIAVPGNQYVYTDLVKNNAVIGLALSGQGTTFESETSATAAVHLEVGDEVWVRVGGHSGAPAIQGARSMFTGFRMG